MSRHQRVALVVIGVTVVLDLAAAVLYAHIAGIPVLPPARGTSDGLDWAVATLTTTGDSAVVPMTRAEHWLSIWAHLSLVFLGAATISYFVSGLTAGHVQSAEKRIKAHVEDRLNEHLPVRRLRKPGGTPP